MAFSNFPPAYPQLSYLPQYQPFIPQAQQPIQQGITWIQGKNAALSYPLPAGQSAILMDSDGPYVYKKETAPDGRPLPMETYRLVKEDESQPKAIMSEEELKHYVKADQIDGIINSKLTTVVREEVERRLSELSFKPTRKISTTEE